MKKNVGKNDKALRTLIALILASLSYFNIVQGTLEIVLLVAAIVLLTTALINFCPLYKLIGINTCKTE